MDTNLENVVIAGLVGLAGWFVKDFLFGLFQKRNQLERVEWEYRLKEVLCPLYFWSGLLTMRIDEPHRHEIYERLQTAMAKAAYSVPKVHYHTLVRLLETAYRQRTSGVTNNERDKMRAYLYGQIELLNLVLYRSEETGGVGDPETLRAPYKRLFRIALIAVRHLVVWLFIALLIGGVLWLYQRRYSDVLGFIVIALLVLTWVDVRRRREVQQGIARRLDLKE